MMMKRDECFRVLARHITDESVVATYSSAVDWVEINPRPLNYLSIGAMGLDSSHGLGLALGRPDRRVVVLQGDGSLLMNLGSLVTIGAVAPKNLVHFVAHNETYEANGGHPIPNRKVDFAGMARSAGYAAVYDFSDLGAFTQQVAHVLEQDGPGIRDTAHRTVKAAQVRLSEPLRSGQAQSFQGSPAGAQLRAYLETRRNQHVTRWLVGGSCFSACFLTGGADRRVDRGRDSGCSRCRHARDDQS